MDILRLFLICKILSIMIVLTQLLAQVEVLTMHVGKYIRDEAEAFDPSQIEEKSLNSLVTHIDKGAEKRLASGLNNLLPQAGFITEEKMVAQEDRKYTWIIDPIDGTTNFIHGLPYFCISIALRQHDEIVLGVVYDISRDELFSAVKGNGATLNKKPIQVSKTIHLKDSILATGFPYHDYRSVQEYLEIFEYFIKHTRGLRRFGAAALDLSYVACGRFDGFFEYGLNIWDVAAGVLLIQEAGGKVVDFKGHNTFLESRQLIAGNSEVVMRMTNVIKGVYRYE